MSHLNASEHTIAQQCYSLITSTQNSLSCMLWEHFVFDSNTYCQNRFYLIRLNNIPKQNSNESIDVFSFQWLEKNTCDLTEQKRLLGWVGQFRFFSFSRHIHIEDCESEVIHPPQYELTVTVQNTIYEIGRSKFPCPYPLAY